MLVYYTLLLLCKICNMVYYSSYIVWLILLFLASTNPLNSNNPKLWKSKQRDGKRRHKKKRTVREIFRHLEKLSNPWLHFASWHCTCISQTDPDPILWSRILSFEDKTNKLKGFQVFHKTSRYFTKHPHCYLHVILALNSYIVTRRIPLVNFITATVQHELNIQIQRKYITCLQDNLKLLFCGENIISCTFPYVSFLSVLVFHLVSISLQC